MLRRFCPRCAVAWNNTAVCWQCGADGYPSDSEDRGLLRPVTPVHDHETVGGLSGR